MKSKILEIFMSSKSSLNKSLQRIREGDKIERETFIQNYIPFIIKSISSMTKRYVDVDNSEEFSVGIIAFNEAIESYDTNKGRNFTGFAAQVIQRRLIDFLRMENRNKDTLPFTSFYDSSDENIDRTFEEKYLSKHDSYDRLERLEDIKQFLKELEGFDISIKTLADEAPSHKDSKRLCIRIANSLVKDETLISKFRSSKCIP